MSGGRPAPEDMAHVVGAAEPELLQATIPQAVDAVCDRHGAKAFATFAEIGETLSFGDLRRQADGVARGLLALGVARGDRIGIWSPNRPEWLLTQFAAARLGAILVNVNPSYRIDELDYALNLVGCKVLVIAEALKSSDYPRLIQSLVPELEAAEPNGLRSGRCPSLTTVVSMGAASHPGMHRFDDLPERGREVPEADLLAYTREGLPSDPINIQFTSGTTGSPKGSTLSHRSILNNARFVAAAQGLTETDVLCLPVPLYHTFGMVMGVLAAISTGASLVFPAQTFDPVKTLRAIASHRCTALYSVPTMFNAYLAAQEEGRFDLSSLRTGVVAGSICPEDLMRRMISDLNLAEITNAYGMTETGPVTFQSSSHDPLPQRTQTVGRVQPHVEAKLTDVDGRLVRRGEVGEICVRGYAVMNGYWNDVQRTAEIIDADGWLHTGDLGTLGSDGYLRIAGRSKDLVIRGGENLFPAEIEAFLGKHPGIEAAAVFGVPDPHYGEELCAWIKVRPDCAVTEDDVRDFCRDRISYRKIPRHIRFVTDFPMTITGKMQKFIMRQSMVQELGLG